MDAPTPTLNELLAHEAWLRRLVRGLVDDHEVDDVVQQTWVAALDPATGAARAVSRPRAWLGQVARNLAMRTRRDAVRQRRRERAAARRDQVPSTDAMLARLDAHRRVARAAAELEEPLRTAVLLRYFEDLSPAAIARHLDVEPSTVRSRLQRGLSRLRGRLERDGHSIPALAALVLERAPLAPTLGDGAGSGAAGATRALLRGASVLTTATFWKGAATIAVLGLGAFGARTLWFSPAPAVVESTGNGAGAASAPASGGAGAPPAEAAGPAARTPMVPGVHAAAPAAAPPRRGRALDRSGRPVPGVPLVWLQHTAGHATAVDGTGRVIPSGEPIATTALGASGADGSFELSGAVTAAAGTLTATDPYVALHSFTPGPDDPDAVGMLVVAPRTVLRGRVLDPTGHAIANVELRARVDGLLEFPLPLDRAEAQPLPTARSAAGSGYYELPGLPRIPELRVTVEHPDYDVEVVDGLDGAALVERDIVLRPRTPAVFRLRGTVVDARGLLVPRAYVALGAVIVRADRFGDFDVRAETLTPDSHVVAGIPGRRAFVSKELAQSLRAEGASPQRAGVVLRLGAEPLEIAGQVVDPAGEPVPDLVLTLVDATHIEGMWTAEDVARGTEPELEHIGGANFRAVARTDAQGRFRITGLDDRVYTVRVTDPKTLVTVDARLAAGTDGAEIAFDRAAAWPEQTGTVRDRRGVPIADAYVGVALATWESGGMTVVAAGAGTRTDAQGRFRLPGVPRGSARLAIRGGGIEDAECAPADVPLAVLVARRVQFRIALGDAAGEATRCEVRSAAGEALEVRRQQGRIATSGSGWRLERGRTPVLTVSEDAHELVLLRDGAVVGRRPLHFRIDTVNVVE